MLTPIHHPERSRPVGFAGAEHDEASLRALICHIGRLMHQAHYADGTSGSISARLDAKRILITPSGMSKGFLQPDQLITAEPDDDNALSTDRTANQPQRRLSFSPELSMHMACYRQRPDIFGVISANPPTAVALTIAGISMRTCVLPETVIVLGLIPTATYSTPASTENQEAIRALISQHDAIMLSHYGSLTVGTDVWQAYLKLEALEHTAMILHRVGQLGPIPALSPDEVAKLLEIRRQLGYWRDGDEERFCEACGAC